MTQEVAQRGGIGTAQMRWVGPAATGAALVGACAYVATHNPYAQQLAPTCLLYRFTGIYCPGCGGTRAAYDLMHGDVFAALHMNAFSTLLIIPPALVALVWWFAWAFGFKTPAVRIPNWLMWSYLALFAAFWLLRNISPFSSFLSP